MYGDDNGFLGILPGVVTDVLLCCNVDVSARACANRSKQYIKLEHRSVVISGNLREAFVRPIFRLQRTELYSLKINSIDAETCRPIVTYPASRRRLQF